MFGRRSFVTAVARAQPSKSINWSRHWKKALAGWGSLMVVTDAVYEVTFLGTAIRTAKESPSKWLNPRNLGIAVDGSIFTLDKSYLADKQSHLRSRPTLCVNLNSCLVSTVYDSEAKRWTTYKRPGLDLFLERASEHYELVVWSSHTLDNVQEVMSRLDPQRKYFHDAISREVEKPDSEEKDLKFLGRPLPRVLVLDIQPNAQEEYRNNTIVIPSWYGNKDDMAHDRALYNILPFLDYLAIQQKYFDLPKLVGAFYAYSEKINQPLPFAFLELMQKQQEEAASKWFWQR
eukprot:NODE_4669_length_1032_cov_108.810781_g4466_i0.p1 GENE.NODE_4669_length_1032_cov_108.810781_g4466_i0~~NODE_4669_length_1032_cov_108.810781_g4466_i0.p1  ORF type:complete len:307 (+),score=41.29 NODE_4669_length_1032_cov_108.810781_g4466_i0:57-923(+)